MQKRLFFFLVILLYVNVATVWAQEAGLSGISIEGTLLMLDDKTPHVAVPVQAIRSSRGMGDFPHKVTATTLSDEAGEYRLVNLKPGQYQVRCQVLGGYVYYRATGHVSRFTFDDLQATGKNTEETLHVERGETLRNINFRFAPFKKGTWEYYTAAEGLASTEINTIYQDSNGALWFGTRGGVSRYDGKTFVNFTIQDGLAGNSVHAIQSDPDGVIWFGTAGGVSRYDGKTFKNLTTADGLADNGVRAIQSDSNGVMWFGTDNGVSRYDGKGFVNLTKEDGLVDNSVYAIQSDLDGAMWFATHEGVSRYDGRGMGDPPHFVNFTEADGLPDETVYAIHRDLDGVMWIGTQLGGVSRYDEQTFVTLTTADGLASNYVQAVHRDPDGVMWMGTEGGLSRYDRGMGDSPHFVTFTKKDGLPHNSIWAIHRQPDGALWVGIGHFPAAGWGGVSRYDGRGMGDSPHFVTFTTEDGLAGNGVSAIHSGSDGALWFGTYGGGVSRYDGKKFISFTTKDGLASNEVSAIHSGSDGVLWFGTRGGGVSRYDARDMGDFPHFVTFTTKDGLPDNDIWAIHRGPDGTMWFGARGGGVSRYNGETFQNFTQKDELVGNWVVAIHRAPDGVMWFATQGGGVSGYDGVAWTSLDKRDGLAHNRVFSIDSDSDGALWFGTYDGVTHYRQSSTPPSVHIVSITTDQTYRDLSAIPAFAIGTRATMEYNAIDLKTLPEKRQYRCRIKEIDSDWRVPTKATLFDHTFKRPGTYTFEVQAIDRDLNYSDPARLEIEILPPPFYTRAGFIVGSILGIFFIPTGIYAILLTRQRKQAFEPIPNPYIVGNPIRSREMFFGRRSDFEFIRIKLASEQAGLVIVFAGERRSGKTSILFQILNGELGERCLPVLLDMQAMTVDSEAEFFEKMASEINEALVRAGINPAPTEFRAGNPTRIFERFIAQTMKALDGRALLLLLDEYELIEAKIDDGVLRPDLITFFASLLEAHPRLSFIFTGSRHLEQRNPAYWHILIGKSLYRHISFLSERDALRLITEPVREQVVYPRGIPERIVRLTAGQPFYTQVVCQNLMDRLNEVQRNRVRQVDVDAVAQELADNPLPQMIYFWDGLEPEQQSALSLLGEVLEDSSGYASAQMLLDFAEEHNLGLVGALNSASLPQLEQILDELFVSEILERERAGEGKYEYRFRVDLFRLWARRAHSVWQTV